jgi:hypothetical protein
MRVFLEKSTLAKANFFTHDWSDKTTWYTSSVRVENELALNSGDNQTFSLKHNSLIDTYHGLIYGEDFIKDKQGFSYRISVEVDKISKTEQDPHLGKNGDFTVDYRNGKIIFLSPVDPQSEVAVTYHYATNSLFVICPPPGKNLLMDFVECQFSDDVVLRDTSVFQPFGFVECFAPQYCTTNGGPYPPGTKIPLGNPVKYKSFSDFQAEATKSYVQYPPMGGDNWRSSPKGITIMNWDYLSATILKSSMGMELRVFLEHDVPFDGWYSTATFYCRIDGES